VFAQNTEKTEGKMNEKESHY